MKTVLCLGGLDPAGRAGILADARMVEACGARPVCVATALTIQSSQHMRGYETVPAETISRQLALLLEDEQIAAIKVGQLGSPEIAALVATLPAEIPLVLDTPLVSSNGGMLFPQDNVVAAYGLLLRRATLVTPNAVEVFLLAGKVPEAGREAAELAAEALPAKAVLLKGGHIEGEEVEDVLLRAGAPPASYFSARVPGRFRGTGCRLASAIATYLALGESLPEAIEDARGVLHVELVAESRSER